MKARAIAEARVALWTLALVASGAAGQRGDDVPLPPRLDASDTQPAIVPPVRVSAPPDSSRLTPRQEEQGADEIIVVGETQWRVPDLGSDWRAEREAEESPARIEATLLPIFDPENPPMQTNVLGVSPEANRVGFIELFQVRFGRRSRD